MTAIVQASLLRYIIVEFLNGEGAELTTTTPLLEWGIIDSMSMIALLAFIEKEFGVVIPDDQVRPEHFATVERLATLVESLRGEG